MNKSVAPSDSISLPPLLRGSGGVATLCPKVSKAIRETISESLMETANLLYLNTMRGCQ